MTPSPKPPPREIGRRCFSHEDQERFASLSHDVNPMHLDPVAARRLLTGRPVVYGIQVLMTALELWRNDDALRPNLLDCTFNSAINVGDTIVFMQNDRGDGRFTIEASVDGLLCAKLHIVAGPGLEPPTFAAAAPTKRLAEPLDDTPESHVHGRYAVAVESGDLSTHYPQTVRALGNARAQGLLALSYFVGMVCPGLHSIFSTLKLRLDDAGAGDASVLFSVDQYDERFRLFRVTLAGPFSGGLTAFLRPPPHQQPRMAEIARRVAPDEFKGSRSLVIGASRGLGETVAKILAAGGGDVLLGYAQGRADVEKVHADIVASGLGHSAVQQIDVTAAAFDQLALDALDAIYFFATPRIGRKKSGVFARALFDEFVDFYIQGLYALCEHVEATSRTTRLKVYVPSSVFIAERPDGMAEYAMAKAASEVMIDDINRNFRKVSITATRLPKLNTDQTTSVLSAANADNLDVLLPVVRAMTR